MTFFRGLRFTVSVLLALAIAGWVYAEVAVELDKRGNYRHVLILQGLQGKKPIIWQPVREAENARLILNPRGDEVGDLAPVVREHPGSGMPWAVWSLNDGTDYEIAYSFFNGRQWVATRMVETGDNPAHDLDPDLAFTRGGAGILAWWRATPVPQVFLSFLENGAWSAPVRISHPEIDSRHPTVRLVGPDVVVTYQTKAGAETFSFDQGSLTPDKTNTLPPSEDPPPCDPETDPDCDISDGPDIDPKPVTKRPRKKGGEN